MAPNIGKMFALLATVFTLLALIFNLMPKWPRIPGDINIDRPGLKIYIPFVSALVISAIITIYFNYFK